MGSTSIAEVKAQGSAVAQQSDQVIDMFSLRGFELAQRIAKAFATSDAVPAIFRTQIEKKGKNGSTWVDNPAAMGNCLVAIETARAVGMSITSVMQHANIIEGKLSWSAQFVIAAINASARFTPLRFQLRNRGLMKAKYKEKLGWNNQKNGFDFAEREVEFDNIECIAWALPRGFVAPSGIYSLKQAQDANLPVIESAPVSMKMAVEEGWYSKSGSKWQTEMKHLMLQYRAGAFFGRIHAPDVVMGMGRTTEELSDMTTIDMAPDGSISSITREDLMLRPAGAVEVVQRVDQERVDQQTGEIVGGASNAVAKPEGEKPAASTGVAETKATNAADSDWTPTPEQQAEIRQREMAEAGQTEPKADAAPASRRARNAQAAME